MSNKIRLLVVDDEPELRATLSAIFGGCGYDVQSAEDGFSALRKMEQGTPDVILSDLNMLGMSGFEFLSVVHRRFPAIYVIAMSGAFASDSVPSGVAADVFYRKGASIVDLMTIMEGFVQSKGVPSLRSPDKLMPIWIHRDAAGRAENTYITISCPECLRAFNHNFAESGRPTYETACIYCSRLIHYAMVELLDPIVPTVLLRQASSITQIPVLVA